MPTRLFRTVSLLFWLLGGVLPVAATHLVGGELTYQYVDAKGTAAAPYRYNITGRIYFNKESDSRYPDGAPTITITVYSQAAGGARLLQEEVSRSRFSEITTEVPGCPVLVPRVTLAIYTTTVSLPAVGEGYTAVLNISNRNAGITNLANSVNEPMALSVSMPPGVLPNSSPVFSGDAVSVICMGDTISVLNNAYDADGDRLSYSFGTPYGASVGQPVSYATGYSATQPFGARGYAGIDARTGLARYFSPAQGVFLVAIDVQEFRTINGREVLLGTLRRDIQVVVRVCTGGPNSPPAFTAATLARKDVQLEEGQSVAFNITATDPDAQLLTMSVGSVLLDGPGRVDATVNGQSGNGTTSIGTVTATGISTVTGAFRLQAGCGLARPSPYDLIVTVADQACNQKTIAGVFRITVTKPAAPTRIFGDSVLCRQGTATYTTPPNPLYVSYRWTVQGGQLLGPATGTTARVQWLAAGGRTISVRGIAASGCPTDSTVRAVTVLGGPTISGPGGYCRSAHTGLRYAVDGPPANYQWTVADGTLVSGQGTNAVVVDIPQGSTATLQVSNPAFPCPTTLRVGPDPSCLYFYNIITPNNDGQNDVFKIENIEFYPKTALTIFNRWGRKVYQTDDYHNNFGGPDTAPGVFYYLCQLADGTRYKGWFEVMR
ncbi:T9SS type B sorting domain-containing protein [Hymenobacter rubidus]|uniref:T9SS type B sorting domain-containing protein n=1 Tax=Hymenobacter rubidus TaxID=1441626 RepID=UPI001920190D|nr:gliding motility-associated C-terminal domain-containing protein [Hymenobacter rubidus]